MRSRYCSRISRSGTACVRSRMRSASVDFPWSMCATMQKFRMSLVSTAGPIVRARNYTSAVDALNAVALVAVGLLALGMLLDALFANGRWWERTHRPYWRVVALLLVPLAISWVGVLAY